MRVAMPDPWLKPQLEDDETLVDRSVTFLRELSRRLREQAGRKWKSTNLAIEVGLLRRRRRQWLLMLGQATFAMLQSGSVDADDLQEHFDRIRELDRAID